MVRLGKTEPPAPFVFQKEYCKSLCKNFGNSTWRSHHLRLTRGMTCRLEGRTKDQCSSAKIQYKRRHSFRSIRSAPSAKTQRFHLLRFLINRLGPGRRVKLVLQNVIQ